MSDSGRVLSSIVEMGCGFFIVMVNGAYIEASGFGYKYPDSTSWVFDLDLELCRGESALIKGESGSGKTTLLYALQGIVPDVLGGQVRGRLKSNGSRPLLALQNPDAAMIAPTVWDEVLFSTNGPVDPKGAEEALKALDIFHLAAMSPMSLSVGQKQRVALAAIMARKSLVTLLDEPLSQLDAEGAATIKDFIKTLARDRCVIIATCTDEVWSHPIHKIVSLSNGNHEPAEEIKLSPPFTSGEKVVTAKGLNLKNSWGTVILNEVDISLRRGEIIKLTGPNGSGKSSLLKILAGAWKVESGTVENKDSISIGYLPQNPEQLLFGRTVADEIGYGMDERKGKQERANEIAQSLGIAHLLQTSPHRLSIGQKQRVALASVLAARPDVLLLDEPTAYLDAKAAQKAWVEIYNAARSGQAVLVTSHRESGTQNHVGRDGQECPSSYRSARLVMGKIEREERA
jgi:energy-coupling factor transporter ATP-binding protein EcfA2